MRSAGYDVQSTPHPSLSPLSIKWKRKIGDRGDIFQDKPRRGPRQTSASPWNNGTIFRVPVRPSNFNPKHIPSKSRPAITAKRRNNTGTPAKYSRNRKESQATHQQTRFGVGSIPPPQPKQKIPTKQISATSHREIPRNYALRREPRDGTRDFSGRSAPRSKPPDPATHRRRERKEGRRAKTRKRKRAAPPVKAKIPLPSAAVPPSPSLPQLSPRLVVVETVAASREGDL